MRFRYRLKVSAKLLSDEIWWDTNHRKWEFNHLSIII